MSLKFWRRLIFVVLFFYWPLIFVLTHITIPLDLIRQMHASDKALHFFVYFILSVLLWYAAGSLERVKWSRPTIWFILSALILYATADEWLQGLTESRTRDVYDLVANCEGLLSGVAMVSFFPFQQAVIVCTSIALLVFTNTVRFEFVGWLYFVKLLYLSCSFAILTYFWCVYISSFSRFRVARFKRLIVALAVPAAVLLLVKLLSYITDRSFGITDLLVCAAAMLIVLALCVIAGDKAVEQDTQAVGKRPWEDSNL
jgi:VanZ family protein